ncbi:MAG: UDP-N-acetylmuramate--L-alanine ligase [Flavobacteriaceae bacterium]|nr:UDP-N-acetylmuramate--L-alanine ligase [Flavobacteriaceae bacterium]
MKLENIRQVYFLGVGGIGMSALARYFVQHGVKVLGYDRTSTELTNALSEEGIHILFKDTIKDFHAQLKSTNSKLLKNSTLIIRTPAVPAESKILNYLNGEGYKIKKRAEVLGLISNHYFSIAVAGTHGKTTTSAMVAHILKVAKVDVLAFLGGIASNFNSNYVEAETECPFVVLEADEYDRSFLHLTPMVSIITSVDADHLDIYRNANDFVDGFVDFSKKTRTDGMLIVKQELSAKFKRPHVTYSIRLEADFMGKNIKVKDGAFVFDLQYGDSKIKNVVLGMAGKHNVENAVAASAACLDLGVTPLQLRKGLKTFKGVKRRFEYIVLQKDFVYIDDYAHHPEELRAAIESVRMMYPAKKITGIFQPHLFSRTRDFAADFARSLSMLDKVILMDIYPAREKSIKGVTSKLIFDKIDNKNKVLLSASAVLDYLKKNKPGQVLMTLGAGDIDTLVKPIANLFRKK